jgi:hypothetical protein
VFSGLATPIPGEASYRAVEVRLEFNMTLKADELQATLDLKHRTGPREQNLAAFSTG